VGELEELRGDGWAVSQLTVKMGLPDRMRLIEGSETPPQKIPGHSYYNPEWEFGQLPEEGVGISFELEPLTPGFWPTYFDTRVTFADTNGATGSTTLPEAYVEILHPARLPAR
jgi:hypothetical protein